MSRGVWGSIQVIQFNKTLNRSGAALTVKGKFCSFRFPSSHTRFTLRKILFFGCRLCLMKFKPQSAACLQSQWMFSSFHQISTRQRCKTPILTFLLPRVTSACSFNRSHYWKLSARQRAKVSAEINVWLIFTCWFFWDSAVRNCSDTENLRDGAYTS